MQIKKIFLILFLLILSKIVIAQQEIIVPVPETPLPEYDGYIITLKTPPIMADPEIMRNEKELDRYEKEKNDREEKIEKLKKELVDKITEVLKKGKNIRKIIDDAEDLIKQYHRAIERSERDKKRKHDEQKEKIIQKKVLINQKQNQAEQQIESKLQKNLEIKNEDKFKWLVNGFALDITDQDAEKIKQEIGKQGSEIEKVEPNYKSHSLLVDVSATNLPQESTALIKANQLWELDEFGQACKESGKQCITGKGIKIAVLDTGIDYTHADFANTDGTICAKEKLLAKQCTKIVDGFNFLIGECKTRNTDGSCTEVFTGDPSDPMDDNSHGTHVASTAAGNGKLKGTAPDAQIIAYKVLAASGSGPGSAIIKAIERSFDPNKDGNTEDKIPILSMSLGSSCGNPDDALSQAIERATANGVTAVIAAGNEGKVSSTQMGTNCKNTALTSQIGSPGAAKSAITVGSVCDKKYEWQFQKIDPADGQLKTFISRVCIDGPNSLSTFSSKGPTNAGPTTGSIVKPDITAPGELITAAWPLNENIVCTERVATSTGFGGTPKFASTTINEQGRKYCAIQGTSMATPHVSGVVALMLQMKKLTPAEVKQKIIQLADNIVTVNEQTIILTDAQKADRKNIHGAGLINARRLFEDLKTPLVEATPTPTPTPSLTLSPTPTVTPSLTLTPTQSPTPTATPTPSPTPNPTLSPTPTLTPTPSPTPSPTHTATPTLTPTPSPTPTRTPPKTLIPPFGPPYDVFNYNYKIIHDLPPQTITSTGIQGLPVTVELQDGIIWKYGYYWDFTQKAWKEFTYNEQEYQGSPWILNKATAQVNIPQNAAKSGENPIIAFACKKQTDGKWKCGCTEEEKTQDTPCLRWMIKLYSAS